jgi:methyl-accepting chemotaxis protein
MGEGQTATLQRLYIDDNPNPTGSKENLDFAPDGSVYSTIHAQFHPWFRQFLRERGYYDIFLFDTDGNLVYTVFEELDYATNLNTGQWRDSDLGNAFRAAVQTGAGSDLHFFDFQSYAPSHGAPAAFVSTAYCGRGRQDRWGVGVPDADRSHERRHAGLRRHGRDRRKLHRRRRLSHA